MKRYTLAEVREEMGVTQKELNRRVERCYAWAGQVERRETYNVRSLVTYARGLGMEMYVSFVSEEGDQFVLTPFGENEKRANKKRVDR